MKKRIVLFSVLFCGFISVQAQIADVTWGDASPFSKESFYSKMEAETKDAFYVLKSSVTEIADNDISLEKYSKSSFGLESSFTIYTPTMYSSKGEPRKMDYDKVIMVKDGFLVFFTEFILKDKTFTSYVQKFSMDGQRVGGLKTLDVFTGNDKTVIGKYQFTPSPFGDGFILCYSRPFILYSSEYFRFRFFDFNLEQKWEKQFLFPFGGKEFDVQKIKASADSSVHMLVRVLDDDEATREKKGNRNVTYSYNLLSFKMDPVDTSTAFKNFPIRLGKKFIANVSFELNTNHEVVLAGYYADKKDMAISGAFYMRVEGLSGLIRTSNMQEFSNEFTNRFIDTQDPNRGVGMRDFELRDLEVLDDGTTYLISEQQYTRVTCMGQPPKLKCTYEDFYNDIVVTRINNEGKVEWTSNIPKRAFDKEKGFVLSYSYQMLPNKVIFIYNDIPQNLKTTNPAELKYATQGAMVSVVAQVNSKGEVGRDILHESSSTKILLRPKTYLNLGNELIIYGIQGKNQYWGKVKVF